MSLTHKVYHQLLGLEVLLHLHPDAVHLELLYPFVLLVWLFVTEDSLRNLLLRQLVPLQLLHLRARCNRNTLASVHIVEVGA